MHHALRSPSSPASLYRCTQSRSVCRSIPADRAASVRFRPSSTSANASIRRDAAGSLLRAAAARSPAASISCLVIDTVIARFPCQDSESDLAEPTQEASSQSFGRLVLGQVAVNDADQLLGRA